MQLHSLIVCFFPCSLWLVKKIPGILFLTCSAGVLHSLPSFASSSVPLLSLCISGEISSCPCPDPRGTCKKRYQARGVLSSCIPFCIRRVKEKTFLNAGLWIMFLWLLILWACIGAGWANAAEGNHLPSKCSLSDPWNLMMSLGERLEITALWLCCFQSVLRVTHCKVRGVDNYREGGAVGMVHVIVRLGKSLWCVFGVYCCNLEQ